MVMRLVVRDHAPAWDSAKLVIEDCIDNEYVIENMLLSFAQAAQDEGLQYSDYSIAHRRISVTIPTVGSEPTKRRLRASLKRLCNERLPGFVAHCARCGLVNPQECGYCSACDSTQAFRCGNCSTHIHARPCVVCLMCMDCCECPTCEHCGARTTEQDRIEDCGHCRRCCRCNQIVTRDESYDLLHTVPNLERITFPDEKNKALAKVLTQKFPCSRAVGVEWEFNTAQGRPLAMWCDTWDSGIHRDGSCGFEMVTTPIAGDNIAKCLGELGMAFEKAHAQANEQCGIHVHVDARDLKWRDMYNLLEVYAKVEPLLYALGGQARALNRYCKPCGMNFMRALTDPKYRVELGCVNAEGQDFEDYKGAIIKVAAGRNRQSMRSGVDKKDHGRYKGLNIAPWLAGRRRRGANGTTRIFTSHAKCGKEPGHNSTCTKGVPIKVNHHGPHIGTSDCTVEFRLHENSLDGERITGWAQLCALLVDWSTKATRAEIEALPKSPIKTLAIIAPSLRPWLAKRLREFHRIKRNKRIISLKKGFTCAV